MERIIEVVREYSQACNIIALYINCLFIDHKYREGDLPFPERETKYLLQVFNEALAYTGDPSPPGGNLQILTEELWATQGRQLSLPSIKVVLQHYASLLGRLPTPPSGDMANYKDLSLLLTGIAMRDKLPEYWRRMALLERPTVQ